jgi:hypothetical protein
VILLVKLPIPLPSIVFVLSAAVGLLLVLQHTPRAVTAAPPSKLILPPLLAEVKFMLLIAIVLVTVGNAAGQSSQVGAPLQNFNVFAKEPGSEVVGATLTQAVPFQYIISPAVVPLGNVPAIPCIP